ncbi:MAG: RpiB/LacA/LacB family sugar-phosphate isomerase [Candidatus Paceibacterota bacterium]
MTIYIGADHRGYELKEKLIAFLGSEGFEVEDMGAYEHDPSDDYPDFILPVAEAVSKDPFSNQGIVLGRSGQGEAMAANRVRGVRAAVFYGGDDEVVKLSRVDNNANVLSIGAGFVSEEEAKKVVLKWLEYDFSEEERHERRIKKIEEYN